ncbi:MAG: hypothetical protein DMD53_09855 [Gemmatimonadetes bacterium]|nr:MAG: hypothetical protein DMD53_09855 [Gemmatimonadota bacterium]
MVARRGGGAVAAVAALLALGRGAAAQVTMTLAQTPNVFLVSPTVADYNVGFVVNPTGILFTITLAGASTNRTTTVSIRSSSATLGGGKPIGDLEWRRADLVAWNAMTTTDAAVESRPVRKNTLNDPWSNQVFLRILLNWASDPPATYTAPIVFTLTVTTP